MKHIMAWLALAAGTAALGACGGGDTMQVAGVGSGGTGVALATGTVTGFGSVVVDGKRWDDKTARVERSNDDDPSRSELAEIKIGQKVEIDFSADGVAKTVRIEAEVVGKVGAIDPVRAELNIAGQVVRSNTNPVAGPVTYFAGGYTQLADVKSDDWVEIHGSARFDSAAGRYVIEATRIEKKPTPPQGVLRVVGVVSNYDASARTFKLGDLAVKVGQAKLTPENRVLANGVRVVVWAKTVEAGPTATASFIRIKTADADPGLQSEVAGLVSKFDVATASFELGGIRVNAKSATLLPVGAVLGNEDYVIARGSFAADGTLSASQIRVRKKELEIKAEAEIKGTITDLGADAMSFNLRGVPIRVIAGKTVIRDCPVGTKLDNGLFVEVEGRMTATGVEADEIECEDEQLPGQTIEVEGMGSVVNVAAKTFVITTQRGVQRSVRWSDLTFFGDGLAPADLGGKLLEVEGYVEANVLVARKIKLDD